ncbi:unnamed protein product [Aphanomyces euteiches]|uniref:PPM-type phosphatase domain-containing protein n=1 Tax=Aphanomyces euteiches TaxID=100861 RepID=A0A6G0XSL7_9STRA|nr:hypothetical protein Ae201684_001753 [Aphanomyces euteiches]KAH9075166.1 hypothetical protein Ae201684P_003850 [Aphanomyces euteiches]KAH9154544.1 hypothetical protein AeRB84_003377 [Aphanomyces euteiches]
MQIDVHGCTDPGNPIKENQDAFLAVKHKSHVALAVFDGHGKTLGRLAAETAKAYFEERFRQDQTYSDLRIDAEATLRHYFNECHGAIRQSFKDYYDERKVKAEDRTGGYLVVKQGILQKSLLVQGGTTASIVILLDGQTMICANVGDSTALLCAPKPFDSSWSSLQASQVMSLHHKQGPLVSLPPEVPESSTTLHLCGDHSPESMTEFHSVAAACSLPNKDDFPELLFVYDGLLGNQRLSIREKHQALEKTPVFVVNQNDGGVTKVNEGSYYKNVRQEWASLCCTPARAKYHESLAFTRSLGDFYIHSFGITHEPDIIQVELNQLMEAEQWNQVLLVVASDGIWDAWQYGDLNDFVWQAYATHIGEMEAVADALMEKNKEVSAGIFGPSVDNMTVVVCSLQL